MVIKVEINPNGEFEFRNKRNQSITFGIMKKNKNLLDPCEAAFLQLSASAVVIKHEKSRKISAEECFKGSAQE